MKKALITGVTGQDGAYLAEFLLENGYEVQQSSTNVDLLIKDRRGPYDHLRGLNCWAVVSLDFLGIPLDWRLCDFIQKNYLEEEFDEKSKVILSMNDIRERVRLKKGVRGTFLGKLKKTLGL